MITKVTGTLLRVLDDEIRLQVGAFEYQVLVAEFVRRALQERVGQEVTLVTTHYFEGNPMQGRMSPRLLGFPGEMEKDFFDLFCTVDKVGIRTAMKALCRPLKEVAEAISRQDAKWLTTLPGIGAATAEKIVATLKRKVTKFALGGPVDGAAAGVAGVDPKLLDDAYQALLSLGHGPMDARERLDRALGAGKKFKDVQEVLLAVYQNG
jgi:Holliday junction DNA helicase RuvA